MISFLHLFHKVRCLFSHQWEPNHIQIWNAPSFNLAAYKNAKCRLCNTEADRIIVFRTEDMVLERSPFQITHDDIVWFIPGYDPPLRTDLIKYGNSLL